MMARDGITEVIAGTRLDYVVSHGRSQYSGFGGVSACGLAAMNCARLVLSKERDGLRGIDLLRNLEHEQMTDDVLAICSSWKSASHLDVEEISQAPIFNRSLRALSTDFGESRSEVFLRLLGRLREYASTTNRSSCVVVTRPPEIIACFYIRCSPARATSGVYVIFDSHPRPDFHPDGAAFIFNSTMEATTDYLAKLMHYDHSLLADRDVQWQAQLLGNVSGHFFVAQDRPQDSDEYWMAATMESSLNSLALRAEVADGKAQNDALTSEVIRLQNNVRRLEQAARANSVWEEAKSSYPSARQREIQPPRKWSFFSPLLSQGSSSRGDAPSYRSNSPSFPPLTSSSSTESARDQRRRAARKLLEASLAQRVPNNADVSNKGKGRDTDNESDKSPIRNVSSEDTSFKQPHNVDDDLAFALEQQRLYDEEHEYLIMERKVLPQEVTFECQICLDKHSQEDVAAVEGCNHQFCRDCMRGYASGKLREHLYPIYCPLCSTERSDKEPKVLSNALMQQIGLTEKEWATFVELEMSSFSVPVHCRSCKNSFFVDREELAIVDIIECPLPQCGKSWCKTCSQVVDSPHAAHSCDGIAELRSLMGKRGWKYCPGCKTPAEKIDGCNHLKCTSPGCKTHFCYLCGITIVTSVVSKEIEAAVSKHYMRCQMFEEIPDNAVPP